MPFIKLSVWADAGPATPSARHIPSAVLPSAILIMSAASDRGRRDMRRHEQEVAALRRHHAEFGRRRLRAHAEEAERRADQDDLAEAQGEKHEDRRNAVERQIAPDQRAVRYADGATGLH